MEKRIVFYTMAMNEGGSERVISTLCNAFVKKDYEIYLICNMKGKSCYPLDDRVKYISLDKTKPKNRLSAIIRKVSPARTKKLKKELSTINPDIVIAFLPEPSLRITHINSYKTILSERCDPSKEYSNSLLRHAMKKLFKNADGFVFQTNEAKKYFERIIQCPTTIIPNPLNNNFIGKKYIGNKKTIVTVGRLSSQKNQEMLIRAFAEFTKKHDNYTLKIYGEGPLLKKLKTIANDCDVSEKVKFLGVRKDLYNAMTEDQIFVLSSNYEGMPNALMEAMALGLPCISTNCPVGGPKTLIKNQMNGILIPVGDQSRLTNALEQLAGNDHLRESLSKNASTIQQELNESIIIEKWDHFITKIMLEPSKQQHI